MKQIFGGALVFLLTFLVLKGFGWIGLAGLLPLFLAIAIWSRRFLR